MATTALIVMAYGSPADPAELEAYYTHIRRGRPPTPELLADLRRRYEAIGGLSPLRQRTLAQVAGIRAALHDRRPDEIAVVLGMKHTAPFIEDAVAEAVAAGAERLVGLVLAPHYSSLSVGEYLSRFHQAADRAGVPATGIESWHLAGGYLHLLAERSAAALRELPERTKVLFTAHSLPERILDRGDPYPDQLRATAAAVAERVGLSRWSGWAVAWQSAGRTHEPWLGPDILEVLRDLAGTGRADGVLVVPAGFVSEHLEVAYDLDIEARAVAEAAGLAFARTPSLDDHPILMAALADVVLDHLGAARLP